MRNFLNIHAIIGSTSREWWVSGSDLAVENTWMWLAGQPIVPAFFYNGYYLPSGNEYNCMLLSYTLQFYGMAQRCSDTWYPICQYSY